MATFRIDADVLHVVGERRQYENLDLVECADGFCVSVQASAAHYCTPRDHAGPYTSVEVGFPSERPEPWAEWQAYCETPEDPTQTVYGWVPVPMVAALLESHGGAS